MGVRARRRSRAFTTVRARGLELVSNWGFGELPDGARAEQPIHELCCVRFTGVESDLLPFGRSGTALQLQSSIEGARGRAWCPPSWRGTRIAHKSVGCSGPSPSATVHSLCVVVIMCWGCLCYWFERRSRTFGFTVSATSMHVVR